MSNAEPQSFKNHARFDPPFHFFLLIVLAANLIIVIVNLVRHPSLTSVWFLVLSVAAILALLKLRLYALKVQDRVIRFEERLRLKALSPPEWHNQIDRLSEDQLIGLRFASDDEIVPLAKQALEQNLNRKQIKERVNNWRPDHWRV
jgi:c-di-AMP phosphodiesterase-like protein